ncbi:uncharacterized protein MEPE_00842 [Melanopsichium pennsylvanicum]|uniref:Alpha/beta hydrolase fold-3 domain-containing protein n=2 Tax=Melanopsichium pennsylvanicum TaxID=63383 RepID=A0AAJ4XI40_9BASI|nr:alpha beta hydrolase [Melanopsichium pennsylvanicum 4]SNX82136.1 uncharacterized protein MEPE_00842 [Melanopsichium pennsylvanicum]
MGIGNAHQVGPQDFRDLLESYLEGKDRYANKHGVKLDWYLPAFELDFATDSKYFKDWDATRVLRFHPQKSANQDGIIYFNGGGFVSSAMAAHSYTCSVLAHRLNACVYMFPYELAPTGTAASQLPKLTDFYLRVASSARKQGHEVIVAGDSAGGSIAACLPQCIQYFAPLLLDTTLSAQDVDKIQPDQLILISPLTRLNMTKEVEERMAQIHPQDWWLTSSFIKQIIHLWVGSAEKQAATVDHFVSQSSSKEIAESLDETSSHADRPSHRLYNRIVRVI